MPQPAVTLPKVDLERALRRAFNLGQTYWQQADSDSYSENRKSDATRADFDKLIAEVGAIPVNLTRCDCRGCKTLMPSGQCYYQHPPPGSEPQRVCVNFDRFDPLPPIVRTEVPK